MPATFAPGDRVGPYVVRSEVGVGGMGEVYRVTDSRLGRDVALKVLPAHAVDDPLALSRFEREAKTVASLNHPNILVLHDVGEEEGRRWVVTELLQGETLRERLDRSVPSWSEAVALVAAAADGLAAAHARGVVHRDLNPRNLFVTRDGFLKILDFGLAFFHGDAGSPHDPTRTQPGSIVGTTGYMSPEQLSGEPVDARTDLFALGCVLYECLTGRRPFEGRHLAEQMAMVLRDDPPPPGGVADGVPVELDAITLRLLAKVPEERHASATDAARALRSIGDAGRTVGFPGPLPVPTPAPRPRGPRSLAVLPFAPTSSDPDDAMVADGLSEAIIRHVSRRGGVRVLAWSTAIRHRDAESPRRAGQELGVDAVLVGRLEEYRDRLVATVELVEVESGEHLWGNRFEGEPGDVLGLQEDIVGRIARRVRTQVSGATTSSAGIAGSVDPAAYKAYLRGRYFWNRRSATDLRRSQDHFQEALEVDPAFAPAWAGLADTYNVLPFWGLRSPQEAFPKAKAACRRAVELDPDLAEAHASLAYVTFYYDWNWSDAERSFRDAIEIDPHYATARHWWGVCSALAGDFDRALEELAEALEIDPLSLIIQADHGLVHYFRGDLDEARRACRSVLEADPSYAPALLYRGLVYEAAGDLAGAIECFDRALRSAPGSTVVTAALGHALGRAGRVAETEALERDLDEDREERYVSPYLGALLAAGLADDEALFRRLDRAFEERAETLTWLRVDPRLRPWRDDPRFVALEARFAAEGAVPRSTSHSGEPPA